MRRHPSKRSLREWLSGEADDKLDKHIDSCEKCAVTLEELDAESGASAIGEALALVLAPPGDLVERLEVGVAARLDSRQVLVVLADLFGAGYETGKLLLTDNPEGGETNR